MWIIKLTGWGFRRSRIVVASLEECLDVIDCFISSVQRICVRYSNVDEIIGGNVLDFLTNFFQVEVNCFWFKVYRSSYIGDGIMGIVEEFNTASSCTFMAK